MAQKTVTKILSAYFNEGDGKRSAREFLTELKELSGQEKYDLAVLANVATGGTVAEVEAVPGVVPQA